MVQIANDRYFTISSNLGNPLPNDWKMKVWLIVFLLNMMLSGFVANPFYVYAQTGIKEDSIYGFIIYFQLRYLLVNGVFIALSRKGWLMCAMLSFLD